MEVLGSRRLACVALVSNSWRFVLIAIGTMQHA